MIDYLIVGQGLAGSILSYRLLEADKNIKIIDNSGTSSSRVAAGLYNPVTGRKMVRTWKADELFNGLEEFYDEIQRMLEKEFLIKKRIYRPFVSVEEQNDWQGRASDPLYKKYIYKIHKTGVYNTQINDDFGGLELSSSGYLDTNRFLDAFRDYFRLKDVLINDRLDNEELTIKSGFFEWKGIRAKNVIFCEGIDSNRNSFFNWLPFHPLKGELLHIKSEVSFEHIINRGVFILETGDQLFKVGSTYNWKDPFSGATNEGRNELLERLKQLVRFEFEVVDHYSGIRPSTKDRRPLIGMHPEIKNMWLFNGLGTKGVTLAPYFAKLFTNYLVNNKALDPQVNINRYYSLYYHLF